SRPPLCSTLFPYTTLFRSQNRYQAGERVVADGADSPGRLRFRFFRSQSSHKLLSQSGHSSPPQTPRRPRRQSLNLLVNVTNTSRSEEHTSELQSLTNLVCR